VRALREHGFDLVTKHHELLKRIDAVAVATLHVLHEEMAIARLPRARPVAH
jgi:hypothetical protein